MNNPLRIAPTSQEIDDKLIALNLARIQFEQAKTRNEKNQAEETFQICYEWFEQHDIAICQNEESGSWRLK